MEARFKHLEFIQGVITRLATDSFRMKGWAVVLIAAFLILLVMAGRIEECAFIVFVPVFVFRGLDGYFLWQERLFRDLYDHVRVLDEADIDFSMDTNAFNRIRLGATFYIALALSVGAAMIIG